MQANGTSVFELARGAGVSPDIVKKLRTRPSASTNAETAARIAAFYGKDVAGFIAKREASEADRLTNLISLLTPEERDMLKRQIEGLVASRADKTPGD